MTPRQPYNPKSPHRRILLAGVESQREAFLARLRQLGAAQDVVDAVDANWDDPEWVERDTVVGMSDTALAAELQAIEREYHEGTHTEEEDQDAERLAVQAAAGEILEEHAPVVIAWVNDDPAPPARAVAVEALEAQRARPRSTVLDACGVIIAAAEDE